MFAYSARAHVREIIFHELTQFFEKNGLNVSQIVSVVTDGSVDGWKAQRLGKQAFRREPGAPDISLHHSQISVVLKTVWKKERDDGYCDEFTLCVRALVCSVAFLDRC